MIFRLDFGLVWFMVFNATYFSFTMAVSFIGGGSHPGVPAENDRPSASH
jgi:hypothetical protein